MTTITVLDDSSGQHTGIKIEGHAGAGVKGTDIVCAGISMLAITTVNAIETYAAEKGSYEEIADPEGAEISLLLKKPNHDTQLLIDSMLLGVKWMAEEYPEQVRLNVKEV